MDSREVSLNDGQTLVVREAESVDATDLLSFVEKIASESDFLTFGAGEFELTESEEREYLDRCRVAQNELFIFGRIGDAVAGTLHFSAGSRPRLRHTGEMGLSVLKAYWGLGIGTQLISTLLDWAGQSGVVTKINLRVRTDNQRAIELYERTGFVTEGTIRREYRIGDRYYDAHWMGLEL